MSKKKTKKPKKIFSTNLINIGSNPFKTGISILKYFNTITFYIPFLFPT